MNTGGVRYKRGVVSESKPGFARVRFDDIDGLVSAWLAVVHPKTQNDQVVWTLDVGEHVACLMDDHMEDGCIVGAIYSDVDVPPVSSAEKFRVQFKDGGSVEYDRVSGQMHIVSVGAVTVVAPSVTLDTPLVTITGHLTVNQGINTATTVVATGNISSAADVSASGVSLKGHAHNGVRSGPDQSGPPA